MRYKQLGGTGLFVSELCLGTMTFGGGEAGRWEIMGSLPQETATLMVRRALDAGINFIDTANVYHDGRSEQIVGQALRDLGVSRSEVVIATKVCGEMGAGPNDRGLSRQHIMDQIDASLRRLGVDHIDLYQLHATDPVTPLDETLQALDDIVRSGKARYIGISNWPAWQIAKAQERARSQGWASFASLQAYYSLVGRDLERELAPMMREERLGLLVWSPLAGGYLTGKYSNGAGAGRRAAFAFPPVDEARGNLCLIAMQSVADAHGCSLATIGLAWLLHQQAVTSVIVGAKTIEQLEQNLHASAITLSAAELASLEEASALPQEYPGWMIQFQSASRMPKPFEQSAT